MPSGVALAKSWWAWRLFVALFVVLPLRAQDIHTLRLGVNGDYAALPVLRLGTDDVLDVSFDDLTTEYRRYTYRLEHLGTDGARSEELFESEYMHAASEREVIEGYELSVNTTVPYIHYAFTLPNAHVRPLISGNYRLVIETEDEDGDVMECAATLFAVQEQVGVKSSLSVSTDTDVDFSARHQQLTLTLTLPDALPLRRADEELRVVVLQNQNLATARRLPAPTSVSGQTARWEHCPTLIFPAASEFRRFESLSTRYPGLHTDYVRWEEPYYRVGLQEDRLRTNYLYDEDHNGLYLIRSAEGSEADVAADYVAVRFTLSIPESTNQDVLAERLQGLDVENLNLYVDGRWTVPHFSDEYRLHYQPESQTYEAEVLLKQGYYDYSYLLASDDAADIRNFEGDFYQTSNEYHVLVYYRTPAMRYERLVFLQKITM